MGKRRRQRYRSDRPATPDEKQPARFQDQLTVFWMLTTLFTLATIVLGIGASAYDAFRDTPADNGASSLAVVGFARFATAVTGMLLLGMTPLVLKVRRVPPPRAITVFVLCTATVGMIWALFT